MAHVTLNHSSIGLIRGISRLPTVNQYLGIQYATLKDRFARGELTEYPLDSAGVLDATAYGPKPLSPPSGCEWEHKLIQKSLPFVDLPESDTECLTLNISAPHAPGKASLPVLVYVHGGAFATGSSCYPQYDLALITKLSLEIGIPIVAVSINYRLGAPGFMYSSAMKEAGYGVNNGLNDQRLALRWIQQHISGFSGDPSRVTFVGESAGGASGCFHLQSDEPLFHQMVAMSGSSQQRLRSLEQAEGTYKSVIEALGLSALSPQQQLQKLVKTPKEDFVTKVGRKFPLGPLIADGSIPEITTFKALTDKTKILELFPGLRYCKRIFTADCQMDGMAFGSRLTARTDILPKTLAACLSSVFDPIDKGIAKAIISAYGIDPAATSNTFQTTEPILNYANDIMFATPARIFAQAWSESSVPESEGFLAHFNCPNPWDGPWKGYATHIQDIVFVFQNYNDHLSEGQRLCAERYANDIISFVNGEKPWPAYEGGTHAGAMVYSAPIDGDVDLSGYVGDGDSDRFGRRRDLEKIIGRENLDKAVDVWQMFMTGPKK